MALKVRTAYFNTFHIPQRCAACGQTPGEGLTWKVSGSKTDWTGKRTTTLAVDVPLCPECHAVSRNKGWAKFVSVMGVIFTILLCLVMAGLVGSGTIENVFLGYGIGIAVIVGFIYLIRWLGNLINTRDFTDEQRDRRKAVLKCARINSFKAPGMFDKTGNIQFQFGNVLFAQEFALMNLGQVE